ncbi:hypothetical protein BON22_0264 [Cyberlindnera fabianii]|uniref:Vacuolar membrane protein n=1 Tax=Cyberlindnera fabianii TaxID=36022 RepID=A0A1V2LDD6_CYBFA|nr:hypothetical protein BON22_0264 [Cyberlindnera fabianii]
MPSLSSMPTISGTASTTWTTPTMTPPTATDNPYVWRSSAPTGTVFIAVGAVAGFILLCLLLLFITKRFLAKRAAKKSLVLTDSSSNSFSNGGAAEKLLGSNFSTSKTNLRKSLSQGKIALLYDTKDADTSVSDFSDGYMKSSEALYSTLEARDNKRRSMFISPTAEVMNLTKNHHKTLSSVSDLGPIKDESNLPESRENYHNRQESSGYDDYKNISLQSPERGSNRAYKPRSKVVPSQYLENMFEE